ncbi:hypothetical protein [Williamsia sp.]|uniref:hypothetical protein n=1 Tax=Williamsia sp. TaxID=1872085 RepID=UPI002F91CEEC
MTESWDRKVPYTNSKHSPYGNHYGNYSTPRRMQTLLTSELRGMGIELSDNDLEAVDWFAQTMSPTAINQIVSWLGRVTQVREPLPDVDPG